MSPSFKEELRAELVAAARRQHAARARRRRLGGIAAAAALLFAVLAGSQVVLTPQRAAADVLIEVRGDRLEVRLLDTDTPLEALRTDLRDAGIGVIVEPVSVGPSNVGRFVGLFVENDEVETIERMGALGPTFIGFSLPVGWEGSFTLFYGVRASDETYGVASDAFSEGEPLHCVPALGAPLDDFVAPHDVEISVIADQDPLFAHEPIPLAEALGRGLGDRIVVAGYSWQEGTALLDIAAHGRPVLFGEPRADLDECEP